MITSKTNTVIKQARALRQVRGRKETGLFLIEGLRHVGAAIQAGWEIDTLLHSPEQLTSQFGQQLVAGFSGRVEEVSAAVLESITEKEHPQGILAIARRRQMRLDSVVPTGCAVSLVSPQDPGNIGTVLRTIDAVGGTALYLLDGGVDVYHPTAIRASMGAVFVVPIVEATAAEFLHWRLTRGINLVGSSARAETDYRQARPVAPWVLMLGSEQKGLSEAQQSACDVTVSLPMRGRATSLNLAVAAGILLFAYTQ